MGSHVPMVTGRTTPGHGTDGPGQPGAFGSLGRPATADLSRARPTLVAMDGRGRDELKRAEAAWVAGRRMVARRERPLYRIADTGDGRTIHVVELPWLPPIEASRSAAIERARDAVASWLGVDRMAVDIERS